jgi:hypothetical protein
MEREEKGAVGILQRFPGQSTHHNSQGCQMGQKKQLTMLATEGTIEGMDHDWRPSLLGAPRNVDAVTELNCMSTGNAI